MAEFPKLLYIVEDYEDGLLAYKSYEDIPEDEEGTKVVTYVREAEHRLKVTKELK